MMLYSYQELLKRTTSLYYTTRLSVKAVSINPSVLLKNSVRVLPAPKF